MRRNLIFVWAMAALMFTVVSCKKDKDPFLKAEYTGTSVSATGGTATFTIESNVDWTIANTDAWITSIEPKTGNGNNTITVTFAANTTTQERSSVFTITSEAPTKSVTIMQAAPVGSLTVEYIPADIPTAGGTATFKITSNVAWTATCPESWVTLNPAQGTGNADVTVTVTANIGSVNRSATITISGEGVNDENVVISQLTDALSFTDIPAGTYAATGTPKGGGVNTGPTAWSNQLVANAEYVSYGFIAWSAGYGGNNINVWIDYVDGELYIDNIYYVAITADEQYVGYFDAGIIVDTEFLAFESYPVDYSKSTKTFDLSGTFVYQGVEYPIVVGVAAYAASNLAFAGLFSELYANCKMTITAASGSPSVMHAPCSVNGKQEGFSGELVNTDGVKGGGKIKFDPAKFSRE